MIHRLRPRTRGYLRALLSTTALGLTTGTLVVQVSSSETCLLRRRERRAVIDLCAALCEDIPLADRAACERCGVGDLQPLYPGASWRLRTDRALCPRSDRAVLAIVPWLDLLGVPLPPELPREWERVR